MDRAPVLSASACSRRSALARALARCALAISAALALAGCGLFQEAGVGGDDPHWQTVRYKGVNSAQVLTMAQTATSHEYPTQMIDALNGKFQTGWIYGTFDATRRQPLRQRVVVEATPEEGIVTCKLRVQQETCSKQEHGRPAGKLTSKLERPCFHGYRWLVSTCCFAFRSANSALNSSSDM